ncbi:MAG: hypothetical protein OXU40_03955, partial [Nitrospira sp.]|nr:hypothetical protein [Nitrospira sp.]
MHTTPLEALVVDPGPGSIAHSICGNTRDLRQWDDSINLDWFCPLTQVPPAHLPAESEPETGRSSRTQPSVVLCAAVLLLTGAVLRLIYLGEIPAGMFTDEASVGYEAWSLLHHGIDRNGYAWPVHFVAWGSGQNVLYSYLSIPLIAVFDLTMFSIRLLMALTGTASLLLFWRVAARDQPAFALLALLLLTFCPWHLMLSRWALECNLL